MRVVYFATTATYSGVSAEMYDGISASMNASTEGCITDEAYFWCVG